MSYPFGKQGIYNVDQQGCDKFHSDREDEGCKELERELEEILAYESQQQNIILPEA